jgi:hypothetical protein
VFAAGLGGVTLVRVLKIVPQGAEPAKKAGASRVGLAGRLGRGRSLGSLL